MVIDEGRFLFLSTLLSFFPSFVVDQQRPADDGSVGDLLIRSCVCLPRKAADSESVVEIHE